MQETFRRRNLPHWDVPGAAFFVTTCLYDSIPARGLQKVNEYRRELERAVRPAHLSESEWRRRQRILVFRKVDELLDKEPANRWLADRRLAAVVRDSLYHFAGNRYEVLAYVVMASHVHWVFRPMPEFESLLLTGGVKPRERIMHTFKLWTARECNRLLYRSGTFWQDESYDHWARGERELRRIIGYVEMNPVRAGMAKAPDEYEFSSACDRARWRIEVGMPLAP